MASSVTPPGATLVPGASGARVFKGFCRYLVPVFVDDKARSVCLDDIHGNVVIFQDRRELSHIGDVLRGAVFEPADGPVEGVGFCGT